MTDYHVAVFTVTAPEAQTIKRVFNYEPEDRELQDLMARYGASSYRCGPVHLKTSARAEALIWMAQRNEIRALPEYRKPQPRQPLTHAECRAERNR
jgi:hypothetical protein